MHFPWADEPNISQLHDPLPFDPCPNHLRTPLIGRRQNRERKFTKFVQVGSSKNDPQRSFLYHHTALLGIEGMEILR